MLKVLPGTEMDAVAAAAAIAALRSSIAPPQGMSRRTIEEMTPNAQGHIAVDQLAKEVERIAAAAGTSFEWIGPETSFLGGPAPTIPQDWRVLYRRLDVSVSQGNSEGWMLTVTGVRRGAREIGEPERADVLLRGKYLGCRFEAHFIAVATREFLIA